MQPNASLGSLDLLEPPHVIEPHRPARIDAGALEDVRAAIWHHLLAPAVGAGDGTPSADAVREVRDAVALLDRVGWPGDAVAAGPVVDGHDARLVMRAGRACLLCGEALARDLVSLPPDRDGRNHADQARRELARGRQVVGCLERDQ